MITMESQGEALELTKSDLLNVKADRDLITNSPIIVINLAQSGNVKINQFTIIHANQAVEVKACDEDVVWPFISEPIFGGSIIFNGFLTDQEASDLADKLNSGKCN